MSLEKVNPFEVYLIRPDAYSVWGYDAVREILSWYYEVMNNEKPAKFLIAKRIESPANPYSGDLDENELWKIHDKLLAEFNEAWRKIRDNELDYEELPKPEYSFLDIKIALSRRLMSPCRICEWKCNAQRLYGKLGKCMIDKECIIHSYFHHLGEEAPLVPSGTIFYGGCNFRCVFCQNYDISQLYVRQGIKLTPERLAEIQRELRITGARNINHVGGDPTPHLPFIMESLKYLDINVPQLWNSNMYLSQEALLLLRDVIDIWLPDFKYGNDECAWKYSKVRNYWKVITRNLKMIYGHGDIIIRHLVLPNHIECCTRKILKWISENIPKVLVNIMDQYRPEYIVARYPEKYPEIARRLKPREIKDAYRIAEEYGIIYKPIS